MKRVAVVGSGIAGLATAHLLAAEAEITLFEAGGHFGGHTNTVNTTLDGVAHGVDTGFLVFNRRTYPLLVRLFDELGVGIADSDMSFSVQVRGEGLEWSGSSLNAVFAQRSNLFRPRFLRMLRDILRFNRIATSLAENGSESAMAQTMADFLDANSLGDTFRQWYFLPMLGSIWSCPGDQMLRFPVATMIRFCHNHGLIQLTDRPPWLTVRGGARQYVEKMLRRIPDARLRSPVRSVRRLSGSEAQAGLVVATETSSERFDDVVLACHSDQSLALLADAGEAERAVLGAIRWQDNLAVLHTDPAVLPRRPRAWAAWNYARACDGAREQAAVCLHYLVNRLQPLPWPQPVVVTLNPDPAAAPDPRAVIGEFRYSHPVFDWAAIRAQQRLPELQGRQRVWYCGAWTGYGFHEDGLKSALDVVSRLRLAWQRRTAGHAVA